MVSPGREPARMQRSASAGDMTAKWMACEQDAAFFLLTPVHVLLPALRLRQWSIPEPRVFSDGEATVTQDTSMGSIKGWTIPLMVGQPGRDRPWTKSCVWSGSTV